MKTALDHAIRIYDDTVRCPRLFMRGFLCIGPMPHYGQRTCYETGRNTLAFLVIALAVITPLFIAFWIGRLTA
jgi:hypothetical protein